MTNEAKRPVDTQKRPDWPRCRIRSRELEKLPCRTPSEKNESECSEPPVRGLFPVLSPVLNMVCLFIVENIHVHTHKENIYVHVYMTNMYL